KRLLIGTNFVILACTAQCFLIHVRKIAITFWMVQPSYCCYILYTIMSYKYYDRLFDRVLLSDLLAIQYPLEWGSLVNLCRTHGPEDKYRLMFLFAVMSFRNDVDMDVVRTLIAFSVLDDLKVLDPPKW